MIHKLQKCISCIICITCSTCITSITCFTCITCITCVPLPTHLHFQNQRLNGSEASTQNSRSESIMLRQNGEASICHKLHILTFHLSAETLIPPSRSRLDPESALIAAEKYSLFPIQDCKSGSTLRRSKQPLFPTPVRAKVLALEPSLQPPH